MPDDEQTIKLSTTCRDGEVPLMWFLATTRGVHVEALPILEELDVGDQVAVVREVAKHLRLAADGLEARAGLAEAVDDVEEAMR